MTVSKVLHFGAENHATLIHLAIYLGRLGYNFVQLSSKLCLFKHFVRFHKIFLIFVFEEIYQTQ